MVVSGSTRGCIDAGPSVSWLGEERCIECTEGDMCAVWKEYSVPPAEKSLMVLWRLESGPGAGEGDVDMGREEDGRVRVIVAILFAPILSRVRGFLLVLGALGGYGSAFPGNLIK
jgi:hypothetical protein